MAAIQFFLTSQFDRKTSHDPSNLNKCNLLWRYITNISTFYL